MVDGRIVVFPPVSRMSSIDGIADTLRGALAEAWSSPVILDCSGVEDVDISLVQLIISARNTAKRDGKTIKLKDPASGALLSVLVQAGFIVADGDDKVEENSFWLHEGERSHG